jgi:xanthine dehydrogenase accessory factor
MRQQELYTRIIELLKCNEVFAIVHVLQTEGSTPQDSGSKMIVHKNGVVENTIGGGTFEAAVITDALHALTEGKSVFKNYALADEEIRMRCGGSAYVYIDVHKPALPLLIFGGGHVARALVEIAHVCAQFAIIVLDDRPEYAAKVMHPKADECRILNANYDYPPSLLSDKHFIVIVTRSHGIDGKILRNVLHEPHAYLGMIGSKKKIKELFDELEQEGISRELLRDVHAPIGLPVGGKSPGEIAISIMAEMLQVKKEKNL